MPNTVDLVDGTQLFLTCEVGGWKRNLPPENMQHAV
jgi:hypothetical protein